MSKYTYTSLASIYSATINGKVHRKNCGVDVCFGSSLSKCTRQQNTVQYTIVLITNPDYIGNVHNNNYCWMSKHQVENYLRRIKSIKPFKFSVRESTWNRWPCYKINLEMTGTKKEITFVLQSIKRTYEFPMNFYLHEAYEMQRLPAFKFDSVLNLFDVAWTTFYGTTSNSGHSYSGCSKFKKYKELREILPNINYTTDLFEKAYITPKKATYGMIKVPQYSSYNVPACTEDWTEENFRKFLPLYIENYNLLKQ